MKNWKKKETENCKDRWKQEQEKIEKKNWDF